MDTSNHRGLGTVLLLLGIVLGFVGQFLYPVTGVTQCANGVCATTTPGLLNYTIAAISTTAFLLGAALLYLAWRHRQTVWYR